MIESISKTHVITTTLKIGHNFCVYSDTFNMLECLAVGWAMKKCHLFLAGLGHFTIVTNHNPLIPIPNSHRLDEFETKIIELSHLEPYVC